MATVGSVAWAPAASAHDELLDLQPGNKVVVTEAPKDVQLVFGAPVLAMGSVMRVTGPHGVVSTGPLAVRGGTVIQKLVAGLTSGAYTVEWRVTSSDGHPVSGRYTFSIRSAVAASTSAAPASTSSTGAATTITTDASGSPTAMASATATEGAGASVTASSPSAGQAVAGGGTTGSGSDSGAGQIVVVAALIAAGAAVAIVLLRRRRGGVSVSNEGNQQ